MSSAFDRGFQLIVAAEGGLVNDPNGGWTNYGVTQATLNAFNKKPSDLVRSVRVSDLTIDEAKVIYKAFYWDVIKGDAIPEAVAILVFDAAINSGPLQAIKWLQHALGLQEDGIPGQQTLQVAQAAQTDTVIPIMISKRLRSLQSVPNFSMFGDGWFRRVILRVMQVSENQ